MTQASDSEQAALPTEDEEKARRRAQHGQRLLNDRLLTETFDNLEEVWLDQLRHGDSPEKREKAFTVLEVLELVKKELRHFVNTGKMVDVAIAQREDQAALLQED